MMERMQQQEVQVKESRWVEENSTMVEAAKRRDRTDLKEEENRPKCTLLN